VKMLADGYTVITDRYYFSSYAYHGVHTDMNWVIASNKMCTQILRPDINIFIDVPPEICMKRISENRGSVELYETLDNLNKVNEKYLEAFDNLWHEEVIVVVNGNREIELIADDIYKAVGKRLP